MLSADILLQVLWTSMANASYQAVLAVAFALVLKVMQVWNFTQPALMGVAFYCMYVLVSWLGVPVAAAVLITLVPVVGLSIGIERFAFQTLRERQSESAFVLHLQPDLCGVRRLPADADLHDGADLHAAEHDVPDPAGRRRGRLRLGPHSNPRRRLADPGAVALHPVHAARPIPDRRRQQRRSRRGLWHLQVALLSAHDGDRGSPGGRRDVSVQAPSSRSFPSCRCT